MFSTRIPIAAARDPETGLIPCLACTHCCHYVAIEVDTPENRRDFDNIRWYLYHPGIEVYIDQEDTWNVLFHSRCENLEDDGKCAVYETRPTICREFDNTSCEPNNDEPAERVIFRTAADLDHWMRLTRTYDRLAMQEAAAARRRERRAAARAAAGTAAAGKAQGRRRADAGPRGKGATRSGGSRGRNGSRAEAAIARTHQGSPPAGRRNGDAAAAANGRRKAAPGARPAARAGR
jgi:Fe-S-cluster containining protein